MRQKWLVPKRLGMWIVIITQLPIFLFGSGIVYFVSPPDVPAVVWGFPAVWFWAFLLSFVAFIGIAIAVGLDHLNENYQNADHGIEK